MEAQELRNFSVDELKGRVKQWQDELFRAKFKAQSSETKDTSIFQKLKKDIARGKTVLTEKLHGVEVKKTAPVAAKVSAPVSEDKPVARASKTAEKAPKAEKKTAKKKSKEE